MAEAAWWVGMAGPFPTYEQVADFADLSQIPRDRIEACEPVTMNRVRDFFVPFTRPFRHLNGAVTHGVHVFTSHPARAVATAERMYEPGIAATVEWCDNSFTCTHSRTPSEVAL